MENPARPGDRRSKRVEVKLPVSIIGRESGANFRLEGEVFSANAHGCGIRCSAQIGVGQRVRLRLATAAVTACIVGCVAVEEDGSWLVGAELDQPANIWGVENPPADWLPAIEAAKGAREAELRAAPQAPPAQLRAVPSQPETRQQRATNEAHPQQRSQALEAASTSSFEQSIQPFLRGVRSDLEATAAATRERIRREAEQELRSTLAAAMQPLQAMLQEVREHAAKIAAERQEIVAAHANVARIRELLQGEMATARAHSDGENSAALQRLEAARQQIAGEAASIEAAFRKRMETALEAAVQHASSHTAQQISATAKGELDTFRRHLRATADEESGKHAFKRQANSDELWVARQQQVLEAVAQAAELYRGVNCALQKLQQLVNGLLARVEAQLRPAQDKLAATEPQAKCRAGEGDAGLQEIAFRPRLARDFESSLQASTTTARERLEQTVAAICAGTAAGVKSDMETSAAPVLAQTKAKLGDAVQRVAQQRDELETLGAGGAQQVHQAVGEALALVKGELRGRIEGALENAEAALVRTTEQMKQDIQVLAAKLQDQLAAQLQQAIEKLKA